jgi:hypothetical protein
MNFIQFYLWYRPLVQVSLVVYDQHCAQIAIDIAAGLSVLHAAGR